MSTATIEPTDELTITVTHPITWSDRFHDELASLESEFKVTFERSESIFARHGFLPVSIFGFRGIPDEDKAEILGKAYLMLDEA